MTLRDAGVSLIDCDHRTPPSAQEGYPYVAIPQLKEGRLDLREARRITRAHYEDWTRKARPMTHDVVLSRRCNPGETAYVPPGLEFALGQNLVLLRADGTTVYPPFLRWLARSPGWWEQIEKFMNVGAVFDSLKCADVPRFELPVPPLPAQRAIAQILGALDDKIDLNRRTSETLEAMARALFKSWFVDFDPVRAKAEGRDPGLPAPVARLFPSSTAESTLGPIPARWSVGTVSDLCESIFSGGTPSTGEQAYWDGGVPWLSSGETRAPVIIDTERTITMRGVQESSTRHARAGAVVVASAGQGQTRGQTSFLAVPAYVNQSVVALLADPSRCPDEYLFFDLSRRYDEFRRVSDGHSSRGSLTTRLIAGLPALLPPTDVVAAFGRLAQPLMARIVSGLRESRTLASLRDTLLPKLISGELRIPDAERIVGEVA